MANVNKCSQGGIKYHCTVVIVRWQSYDVNFKIVLSIAEGSATRQRTEEIFKLVKEYRTLFEIELEKYITTRSGEPAFALQSFIHQGIHKCGEVDVAGLELPQRGERRVNNIVLQPLPTLRIRLTSISTSKWESSWIITLRARCSSDKIVGEAMSGGIGGRSDTVTWQSAPCNTRFWP